MSITIEAGGELLPQKQFAEEVERTPATLHYWRQTGQGPAAIKVGRNYFYSRREIDRWIAAGGNTLRKRAGKA